jgi:hypothetical protein
LGSIAVWAAAPVGLAPIGRTQSPKARSRPEKGITTVTFDVTEASGGAVIHFD